MTWAQLAAWVHLVLALLFPDARAQMWPNPGPGHASYVPPLDCAASTDFSATARHIYFWKLNDWATATIPEDEGPGTQMDWGSAGTAPNESNLTSTGLPSGTPGSGYYLYPFTSSESPYHVVSGGDSIVVSSANADWSMCGWYYTTSAATAPYFKTFINGPSVVEEFGIATSGTAKWYMSSIGQGGVLYGSTTVSSGTWYHLCITSDNDGSLNGTDTRTIYVNGVAQSTDSGPDNSQVSSNGQWEGRVGTYPNAKYFEMMFYGSALTQNQVCDIMLCGIDKSADPNTRKSSYATGTCASHTPGS